MAQLTNAKRKISLAEDGDSSMRSAIWSELLLVSLVGSRSYERILNGNRIGLLSIGHYCRYVTALECAAAIYDHRLYDRRRSFLLRRSNRGNNSRRSTVIRSLERARALVLKRRGLGSIDAAIYQTSHSLAENRQFSDTDTPTFRNSRSPYVNFNILYDKRVALGRVDRRTLLICFI